LSYTQTDINYSEASVRISSNFLIIDNIPVNKDVDSTFYISSLGNVKIYLYTKNPLEINKDTLFISYIDISGNNVWDTIYKTINGYYKEVRVKTPYDNFWYGRGYNQIHQDPNHSLGIIGGNLLYAHITGDPYIDNATLNY
jgi:hypothetical protein